MVETAQLVSHTATHSYLPELCVSQSGLSFFAWYELQALTAKTPLSNGAPLPSALHGGGSLAEFSVHCLFLLLSKG